MEAIRVERSGGLVTITLDRPEKKNALNAQAWVELDRSFAEVAVDPDARALILTGAGGNLSAGADLSGNPSGKGLTGGPLQPIVQEMRVVGRALLRDLRQARARARRGHLVAAAAPDRPSQGEGAGVLRRFRRREGG